VNMIRLSKFNSL